MGLAPQPFLDRLNPSSDKFVARALWGAKDGSVSEDQVKMTVMALEQPQAQAQLQIPAPVKAPVPPPGQLKFLGRLPTEDGKPFKHMVVPGTLVEPSGKVK